jgi:hypothetical protein
MVALARFVHEKIVPLTSFLGGLSEERTLEPGFLEDLEERIRVTDPDTVTDWGPGTPGLPKATDELAGEIDPAEFSKLSRSIGEKWEVYRAVISILRRSDRFDEWLRRICKGCRENSQGPAVAGPEVPDPDKIISSQIEGAGNGEVDRHERGLHLL